MSQTEKAMKKTNVSAFSKIMSSRNSQNLWHKGKMVKRVLYYEKKISPPKHHTGHILFMINSKKGRRCRAGFNVFKSPCIHNGWFASISESTGVPVDGWRKRWNVIRYNNKKLSNVILISLKTLFQLTTLTISKSQHPSSIHVSPKQCCKRFEGYYISKRQTDLVFFVTIKETKISFKRFIWRCSLQLPNILERGLLSHYTSSFHYVLVELNGLISVSLIMINFEPYHAHFLKSISQSKQLSHLCFSPHPL